MTVSDEAAALEDLVFEVINAAGMEAHDYGRAEAEEALSCLRIALRAAIDHDRLSGRLSAAQPHMAGWRAIEEPRRWRHKKRGSTYVEIGRGMLQVSTGRNPSDYDDMVVYRCEKDGQIWIRPVDEFEDGRFSEINE